MDEQRKQNMEAASMKVRKIMTNVVEAMNPRDTNLNIGETVEVVVEECAWLIAGAIAACNKIIDEQQIRLLAIASAQQFNQSLFDMVDWHLQPKDADDAKPQ